MLPILNSVQLLGCPHQSPWAKILSPPRCCIRFHHRALPLLACRALLGHSILPVARRHPRRCSQMRIHRSSYFRRLRCPLESRSCSQLRPYRSPLGAAAFHPVPPFERGAPARLRALTALPLVFRARVSFIDALSFARTSALGRLFSPIRLACSLRLGS